MAFTLHELYRSTYLSHLIVTWRSASCIVFLSHLHPIYCLPVSPSCRTTPNPRRSQVIHPEHNMLESYFTEVCAALKPTVMRRTSAGCRLQCAVYASLDNPPSRRPYSVTVPAFVPLPSTCCFIHYHIATFSACTILANLPYLTTRSLSPAIR